MKLLFCSQCTHMDTAPIHMLNMELIHTLAAHTTADTHTPTPTRTTTMANTTQANTTNSHTEAILTEATPTTHTTTTTNKRIRRFFMIKPTSSPPIFETQELSQFLPQN